MTTVQKTPTLSVRDVLKTWLDAPHRSARICPGCNLDITTTVGLSDMAYTFETCTCGTPEYAHLYEQLWHRVCLIESGDDADE